MRKPLYLIILLVATVFAAGCERDNGPRNVTVADRAQLSQTAYADDNLSNMGGVTFTSATPWTVRVEDVTEKTRTAADWVTLNRYQGEAGTHTLSIGLDVNYWGVERKARITINADGHRVAVNVTQSARTALDVVPAPGGPGTRTLFVYMAADNSLGSGGGGYDVQNLNAMVAGATARNMNGGQVVVYHDPYAGNPRLLKIYAGSDGKGRMDVVWTSDTEQNSSATETFADAVSRMQSVAPADSYGLVLWSHGLGWMPASLQRGTGYGDGQGDNNRLYAGGAAVYTVDPRPMPQTRALIEDDHDGNSGLYGIRYMEMNDLAAAMPAGLFDFVIADLCYMGSVEFAYAMSGKTDYIVASPAEVIAQGMPYDKIMPHIFAATARLGEGGVAQAYFDYYNDMTGTWQSATTALYDCSAMGELAAAMRGVVAGHGGQIDTMDLTTLQLYDRNSKHTMFDLKEFADALEPGDAAATRFADALAAAVPYRNTTGRMITFDIPAARYSGISTYVPVSGYTDLTAAYKQTGWYQAVYGE